MARGGGGLLPRALDLAFPPIDPFMTSRFCIIVQAGTGGYLKMWDPDLRDTTAPLCVVDLKAFALKGDPQLNARTSGRGMDWTTSKVFLRYIVLPLIAYMYVYCAQCVGANSDRVPISYPVTSMTTPQSRKTQQGVCAGLHRHTYRFQIWGQRDAS